MRVVDAGDVEMAGVEGKAALDALEKAVRIAAEAGAIPLILGGDHTITWPDVTGVAHEVAPAYDAADAPSVAFGDTSP